MQKLVVALGISTKTMYKYFANKETLLEECLNIHYKEMDKGVRNLLEASPNAVASLSRIYSKSFELDFGTNQVFYHDLNYYYPQLQDKVIKQYSSDVFKLLIQIISQGIEDDYFLPNLKPEVVLQALTVLYTSVTRSDSYKKFKLKPDDIIKHTITIYLRGICTEKGIQITNLLTELSI